MSESVSVLALARLWAHGVGETGQGQRTCPMSKPEKARRSKDDKEERKSVEKEGRKSKRKAERDDPPPHDGEEPEEVKDWRSAEKVVDEKKKEEEIPGAKKYKRGEPNQIGKLKDKKLKLKLQRINDLAKEAANKAALSEILLPSEAGYLEAEGIEKTQRFSQKQIKQAVDVGSSKKIFTLKLDTFGPYEARYSRNGRHLLLGGRLGHLASCDWMDGKLTCEVHVKETVRDVCYLHNETMFAAAQKKYVYIYDHQGLEVHCLRNHVEVNRMDFLPYHHLLVTVGSTGVLRYADTSTGQGVAEYRTQLGRCDCLRQNPHTAVMLLGHGNGTVTMWSPAVAAPLVKMFCHRGPVQAAAVDAGGNYLATCGLDCQLSVWDLRTYKRLHRGSATERGGGRGGAPAAGGRRPNGTRGCHLASAGRARAACG